MKSYKLWQIFASLLLILSFQSCDKEDDTPAPIEITFNGITFTIPENPTNEQVIGELPASVNRGDLAFSLKDQDPAGAMAINPTSGQLTVLDASKFDFETNPTVTATGVVTVEGVEKTALITVNLSNVAETVTTTAFAVTIDENPTANQVLGNVSATTDAGTITYSLADGGFDYAFNINSTTGELSVKDVSVFDFETNPTVTATFRAGNGVTTQTGAITVNLNDVAESTPEFITTWETTSANEDITIYVNTDVSGYNYSVDWGDGSTSTNQTTDATHTYATAGTHKVKISGAFPAIYSEYANRANAAKLKTIENWGDIAWKSMSFAFSNCSNLIYNATDNPDLSNVTDMSYMFSSAPLFNGDISSWDVSTITNMLGLFNGASAFNQDISSWDVSNVTNMQSVFANSNFDNDISSWDVSSATNIAGLFNGASAFNQDISSWDVSNVTNMQSVFANSNFDNDISSWDISKVTNLSFMFYRCPAFNQDISSWDVSSATTMAFMFESAASFNQDISSWDVSAVTNMRSLFLNAELFNQDISSWDVDAVTDMRSMFYLAGAFNQNLAAWDVSSVTNMNQMFRQASSFDSDISSWNISNVTNMSNMFNGASAFNYDLSGWSTDNVISCSFFNSNSALIDSHVPTAGTCF
jgi:surface protein